MNSQLQSVELQAIQAVAIVLGLATIWLLHHLASWISARTTNVKIQGIIGRLDQAAETVVKDIQQTFVSTLSAPTATELVNARTQALTTLKTHLGPKGLQDLESILGLNGPDAVTQLLVSTIEAKVHDMKWLAVQEPLAGASTISNPTYTVLTATKTIP